MPNVSNIHRIQPLLRRKHARKIRRRTNLKLLVVPGDDVGAAELAVHAEGAHLRLEGVPQLLPRLQVPDEVGLCVVQLESLSGGGGGQRGEQQEKMHSVQCGPEA